MTRHAILKLKLATVALCVGSFSLEVVPASCMEELRDVGGKHKSLDISFHSFQRPFADREPFKGH